MFIRIESSSGVPITRQILDQIRAHCATGSLEPGEKLPSVRALALELAVNQNTVLRVYERLTMEGLLEMHHGDGTYVSMTRPAGQIKAQRDLLQQEVERLVRRAHSLGVGRMEIHQLLDRAISKFKVPLSQKKGMTNDRHGDPD
jgi:GntR family transcriptional regulator